MSHAPPEREAVTGLRAVIEAFIQARLEPKQEKIEKQLEKENDPDNRTVLSEELQTLRAKYQREAWLEDAARRACQLQMVTHAIKYTHPSAKEGSNIYVSEVDFCKENALVGTHTLGSACADDIAGNAAALDVYQFLKLEYAGQSLLSRVLAKDATLAVAFSEQSEQANTWLEGFAAITTSKGGFSSHTLTKQVYFPLQSGDYHLLAPLFPSSLMDTIYHHFRSTRFSEEVKQARQAHKEEKPHPHGYREYPDLLLQSFGGTKPQNISQLNSERHGENWLMPSFPPTWHSESIRPPLGIATVFGRWFGNRQRVRDLTRRLAHFLSSTSYNTLSIRETRADMVDDLCDEVWQFAAEVQQLPGGWSGTPECRLNAAEALWLDPGRGESDLDFAAQRRQEGWADEVAKRFGNWLNHQLIYLSKNNPLAMGEVEQHEWIRQVREGLIYE